MSISCRNPNLTLQLKLSISTLTDKIFQAIEEIKAEQRSQKKLLLDVKQRPADTPAEPEGFSYTDTLPLNTQEDVNNLERMLLDQGLQISAGLVSRSVFTY